MESLEAILVYIIPVGRARKSAGNRPGILFGASGL
jgi:hypothetical protein